MSGPTAALAVCRAGTNAVAMMLWGGSVYLATLVPPSLRRDLWYGARRVRVCAAAALLVVAALTLPCLVATIGDGWASSTKGALIGAVLLGTTAGHAWMIGGTLSAMLLVAVVARGSPSVVATLSGLLLASLCLTGHAAADEGMRGVWHRANDILHVWAGGAWLGALLPLLPILRALDNPARRHDARRALHHFSVAGHGAVALVLATGALNTALVLGRWPTDPRSPYQLLLITKIVLVVAMTGLAFANRYGLVPRMAGPDRAFAAKGLRSATIAEIAIGGCVIVLVAVFGLLDPV